MDEEIRHKIIHLALSLFKQYGTKSTTMEDIADALKISKKTLYMYFHSKKELLQATLDHNFALHERKIVEILSQDFTSLEKFMRIYEYAISFLVTYHPSYFYDIKKYHREIDKSYETRKKEMISNRILALLQKAQEDGEIIPSANLELFCKLYLIDLDENLSFINLRKKYPIHELLNHFIIFNLRGIATDPSKIPVH